MQRRACSSLPMRTSSKIMLAFAAEFAACCQQHAEAIAVLEVRAKGVDLDDFHWDLIADLKDNLGSSAANEVSSPAAQDRVRDECDQWVTDKYSNSAISDVALAFWLYGTEDGAARVLAALSEPSISPAS